MQYSYSGDMTVFRHRLPWSERCAQQSSLLARFCFPFPFPAPFLVPFLVRSFVHQLCTPSTSAFAYTLVDRLTGFAGIGGPAPETHEQFLCKPHAASCYPFVEGIVMPEVIQEF